jgi:DNA-binding transcriptional LysR family regulator
VLRRGAFADDNFPFGTERIIMTDAHETGVSASDRAANEAAWRIDPDLGLLRTFAVTVRSRSLTDAAARLGLSQPGLSRRIARLERSVGTRLVDRSRSGLRPTVDGELLLRAADRILHEVDGVMGRLASRRQSISGELHIQASTIPGEHLLPAAIASFLGRHREVGFRLEVSRTATVIDAVAEGLVDLGVCGDRIDHQGVEFRPLVRDTLVLAVPEGHELARRGKVGLGELGRLPLLTREAGSGTQRVIEGLLSDVRAEAEPVPSGRTPARAFGSTQAILAAVRSGIGFALVSAISIGSAPGVRGIPVQGMESERWLWLATPVNVPTQVAAAAFIEHLQRTLSRSDPKG